MREGGTEGIAGGHDGLGRTWLCELTVAVADALRNSLKLVCIENIRPEKQLAA